MEENYKNINDILKNINNQDFNSLDNADNLYYNDYNYIEK